MTDKRALEKIERAKREQEQSLAIDLFTEIPKELFELTHLKDLKIFSLTLTELPKELFELKQLAQLAILGVRLTVLPKEIGKLKQLTKLNISSTRLTELPKELFELKQLTELTIYTSQLTELPNEIGELKQLQSLNLSHSLLTELPSEIGELKQLQTLDISFNQLTELPSEIGELKQLHTLNISYNQLTDLPQSIMQLSHITNLTLHYNKLKSPPQQLAEESIDAIRNYFKQLEEQGEAILRELKIQIVGNPQSGKTTLLNALALDHNPNFKAFPTGIEDRTNGINVYRNWQFTHENTYYSANWWDFGGQRIQYMTHHYLLSDEALFVLVLDPREIENNTHYWFQIMDLLGKNSPIVVVLNQHTGPPNPAIQHDIQQYIRQYPGKSIVTKEANLLENDEVSVLIKHLKQTIAGYEYPARPASWPHIERALSKLPKKYISVDEFYRQCENEMALGQYRLTDLENKEGFLAYLRTTGQVIHYPQAPALKKYVFLKPEWIAQAFYRLFKENRIEQCQGIISESELYNIWHGQKDCQGNDYTNEEIYFFMELMFKNHFEVAYHLDQHRFVLPQWLPETSPKYSLTQDNRLHYRLTYCCLPYGMITHLMVHFHKEIHKAHQQILHWRTGFVLQRTDPHTQQTAYAVVTTTQDDHPIIDILSSGDAEVRKDLSKSIIEQAKTVHYQLRMIENDLWITEQVACPECLKKGKNNPAFFKVAELKNSTSKYCETCRQTIDSRAALGEVFIPQTPIEKPILGYSMGQWERIKRLVFGNPITSLGIFVTTCGLVSTTPLGPQIVAAFLKNVLKWDVTAIEKHLEPNHPAFSAFLIITGILLIVYEHKRKKN